MGPITLNMKGFQNGSAVEFTVTVPVETIVARTEDGATNSARIEDFVKYFIEDVLR